jgi:uncharacterized protein
MNTEFKELAQAKFEENKQFLIRLKDKKPKKVDDAFLDHHDDVFTEMECLSCANCCKTTSPIFMDKDIERIAKHLRMRPSEMIEKYLHLDEDNDYVLNESPCVFLDAENYCTIYDVRPKACREYPHTNRKNMAGLTRITIENTRVCPGVFEIVERLKKMSW